MPTDFSCDPIGETPSLPHESLIPGLPPPKVNPDVADCPSVPGKVSPHSVASGERAEVVIPPCLALSYSVHGRSVPVAFYRQMDCGWLHAALIGIRHLRQGLDLFYSVP